MPNASPLQPVSLPACSVFQMIRNNNNKITEPCAEYTHFTDIGLHQFRWVLGHSLPHTAQGDSGQATKGSTSLCSLKDKCTYFSEAGPTSVGSVVSHNHKSMIFEYRPIMESFLGPQVGAFLRCHYELKNCDREQNKTNKQRPKTTTETTLCKRIWEVPNTSSFITRVSSSHPQNPGEG